MDCKNIHTLYPPSIDAVFTQSTANHDPFSGIVGMVSHVQSRLLLSYDWNFWMSKNPKERHRFVYLFDVVLRVYCLKSWKHDKICLDCILVSLFRG